MTYILILDGKERRKEIARKHESMAKRESRPESRHAQHLRMGNDFRTSDVFFFACLAHFVEFLFELLRLHIKAQ